MSWNDCDEAMESGDWLKWDANPFVVKFLGQPEIEKKEFKGKIQVQAIFKVIHDGEEKRLGCSKRAYAALRALGQQIGSKKFYETPIQCVRTGSGFQTEYTFTPVDSAAKAAAAGMATEPDDDDLPF